MARKKIEIQLKMSKFKEESSEEKEDIDIEELQNEVERREPLDLISIGLKDTMKTISTNKEQMEQIKQKDNEYNQSIK